jgi:hypothetical protein
MKVVPYKGRQIPSDYFTWAEQLEGKGYEYNEAMDAVLLKGSLEKALKHLVRKPRSKSIKYKLGIMTIVKYPRREHETQVEAELKLMNSSRTDLEEILMKTRSKSFTQADVKEEAKEQRPGHNRAKSTGHQRNKSIGNLRTKSNDVEPGDLRSMDSIVNSASGPSRRTSESFSSQQKKKSIAHLRAKSHGVVEREDSKSVEYSESESARRVPAAPQKSKSVGHLRAKSNNVEPVDVKSNDVEVSESESIRRSSGGTQKSKSIKHLRAKSNNVEPEQKAEDLKVSESEPVRKTPSSGSAQERTKSIGNLRSKSNNIQPSELKAMDLTVTESEPVPIQKVAVRRGSRKGSIVRFSEEVTVYSPTDPLSKTAPFDARGKHARMKSEGVSVADKKEDKPRRPPQVANLLPLEDPVVVAESSPNLSQPDWKRIRQESGEDNKAQAPLPASKFEEFKVVVVEPPKVESAPINSAPVKAPPGSFIDENGNIISIQYLQQLLQSGNDITSILAQRPPTSPKRNHRTMTSLQ